MKVAIVGAGGIGGSFGALLHLAGVDVTLIEVDPRRVEAISKNGLEIVLPDGSEKKCDIKISDDPSSVGVVDLIQISVKGYHTESAAKSIKPMVGPETYVLSVQNGLGNLRRIAEHVPEDQILGGITALSAMPLGLNRVKFNGGIGGLKFGRLDGTIDDRLKKVAETFNQAGLEVHLIEGDIRVPIWRKLLANAGNCVAAMTGFTGTQLMACEETKELTALLANETAEVAKAEGLDFPELENAGEYVLTQCLPGVKDNKISMLQDVEANRRTEIDTLNAEICRVGKEHGVPTPVNHVMTLLIKAREQKMLWDMEAEK
ncbi:MAG: 2-dehydropantoate 2-reductase [Deltaproteobacteria bacterium]|nr:2-dehydropantoate 2-reductase [Deltaproteobacteria bacterium]